VPRGCETESVPIQNSGLGRHWSLSHAKGGSGEAVQSMITAFSMVCQLVLDFPQGALDGAPRRGTRDVFLFLRVQCPPEVPPRGRAGFL